MPDTKHVLKMLRDELSLQTRHRKLLEAQEQALLACDRARFAGLQVEYAQMLAELEAQDDARKVAMIGEEGEPLTLSELKENVSLASRAKLDALGDMLRETLGRVQTLTRRNKTLITNELDYIAFTLDLFVEAGRSNDVGYGPQRGGDYTRLTGRLMPDRRA